MGFEQSHEPANELPQETRTFSRMIVSRTEEAEAINWYEQRIALEKDYAERGLNFYEQRNGRGRQHLYE